MLATVVELLTVRPLESVSTPVSVVTELPVTSSEPIVSLLSLRSNVPDELTVTVADELSSWFAAVSWTIAGSAPSPTTRSPGIAIAVFVLLRSRMPASTIVVPLYALDVVPLRTSVPPPDNVRPAALETELFRSNWPPDSMETVPLSKSVSMSSVVAPEE